MRKYQFCTLLVVSSLAMSSASFAGDEAAKGKDVFNSWCASCHAPGLTHPGTLALHYRYQGQLPGALEERGNLTEVFVRHIVRNGINGMPPIRKTEVTDAQLNELVAYLTKGR